MSSSFECSNKRGKMKFTIFKVRYVYDINLCQYKEVHFLEILILSVINPLRLPLKITNLIPHNILIDYNHLP